MEEYMHEAETQTRQYRIPHGLLIPGIAAFIIFKVMVVSTGTFLIICSYRSGQRTTSESISFAVPNPKCKTSDVADKKPLVGNCSATCSFPPLYIVTRAPIPRVFIPFPFNTTDK